jgi:arylsulfatase A-like enzyme
MKGANIYFYLIACFVLFQTGIQSHASNRNTNKSKPNILFIAIDDLRPELGSFGASHIKSPSIDKLAAEALVFTRTYCNIPVCGASRASVLSGVRPGIHRFLGYNTYQQKDYPGVLSLPMHYKNNGYTTISNGKIYHHADDDQDAWAEIWKPRRESGASSRDYLTSENLALDQNGTRGFPYEEVDVPDTAYFDGKIAQKSIEDLKKLKADGEPFFLAVGFLKPHLPFNAPTKYWDMYNPANISLPDNYQQPASTPAMAFHNSGELRNYSGVPKKGEVSAELANKLLHGYYACVSYTDAQIGKLLATLDELELTENTIVILWGDHGWNLGDHMMWCKHCNFESSLHVPMIVKAPGITSGQKTDAITEYVDIYPSLCELSNLPIPQHVDGESFVPLLKGQSMKKNYAISKFMDGVTLVKENYFYTEFIDKKGEMKERMLFDHNKDPLELDNLAEKPVYKNKVKELSTFLRANWGDDFFLNRREN